MKNEKHYYIITFTRTHIKITEEQRSKILKTNANEVDVDGQIIKQSNIAEILDEHKYFEAYPDKMPRVERNVFEDLYGDQGNQQIRQPSKQGLSRMHQGFLDYFTKEKGLSLEEAKDKLKAFTV